MYRRILVPLDGSDFAERALPHAEALARRFSSEILLLRVEEPIPGVGEARYPEEVREAAHRYLSRLVEPLRLRSFRVRELVEYGEPAETILRVMEEAGADLVVMATHARAGLPRLFTGSVAERVLRSSRKPVLLVPPNA